MSRLFSRVQQIPLSVMVIYIDGIVQAVTSTNDREIATAEANDLLIGTNSGGNHLSGVIDEFRLYEVGLSSNDVMSIFLDGTMMFTTSATAQPPVVELSKIVAEANASVTVIGELVSKDLTNPVVRVYYGLEDGGFNPIDWNNSFVLVDGGSPFSLENLMPPFPDLFQDPDTIFELLQRVLTDKIGQLGTLR